MAVNFNPETRQLFFESLTDEQRETVVYVDQQLQTRYSYAEYQALSDEQRDPLIQFIHAPLTSEQHYNVIGVLIDLLTGFSGNDQISILEELARTVRTVQKRRKWEEFPEEVEAFRSLNMTLNQALLAARDANPLRYGRTASIQTLKTRYREEKAARKNRWRS